jgi:hypothetical protein
MKENALSKRAPVMRIRVIGKTQNHLHLSFEAAMFNNSSAKTMDGTTKQETMSSGRN